MTTSEEATVGLFQAARRTPFNIAPERSQALAREVFGADDWELRPSRAEANFYAVVNDKAIYLSFAGLASLWCVAFTGYCVMDVTSRAARDPAFKGKQIDFGACWAQLNLSGYVDYAKRLFQSDERWPEGLCRPIFGADLESVEGRVNNLFFGALSWILLHEIAHVHHGHSNLIPASMKVSQEYQADAFATSWVLEDAGTGLTREFRVLVVCVALAWLLLLEQKKGLGYDHPATILRFREAVAQFETGERSVALENATYLFKALFDPETEMPTCLLAREAFGWVCQRLESKFAANG